MGPVGSEIFRQNYGQKDFLQIRRKEEIKKEKSQ